jgi:hypothetical protein
MVNGIPVKLTTPDKDGNLTQIETVCFATVRKCPKLSGAVKDIIRADKAETGAVRRAQLAEQALSTCEDADALDELQKKSTDTAEAANDATQAVMDSIRAFVLTSLIGAGYKAEQAERYADLIPMERLPELKAAAMIGSGRLDFTTAPTAES